TMFSEDVLQQLRRSISDSGLIADISRCGYRHAEPDDSCHFVERSQMLPNDGETIDRRKVGRLASLWHIELRADTSNEFRHAAFRGQHPAQKKQIARQHGFRIDTKWLRRRWELDAKLFQPLFSAGPPDGFRALAFALSNLSSFI